MKNFTELRKHQRVDASVEVTFSSKSFVCSNVTLNLSLGGVCFESWKPLERGEKIHLVLHSRTPVKLPAEVAWCRKNGMTYLIGCRFLEASAEQKKKLQELVGTLFWGQIPVSSQEIAL